MATKRDNERIAVLETDMKAVKFQVSNHIPTSIRELDNKIDKINLRLAYASGAIAIIVIMAQILINKWG